MKKYTRNALIIIAGLTLVLVPRLYAQTAPSGTVPAQTAQSQAQAQAPSANEEYGKLKSQYDAVVIDRDNIIAQTKLLLEQRNKYQDTENALAASEEQRKKAQEELNGRLTQNTILQQKVEELQQAQAQTVRENEALKNSLEKLQIEYKMLPETRKEITRLQQENTDLARQLKTLQAKFSEYETKKLDAYAQAETYRRQLNDFRKRYEQALGKNRALEKKIAALPSKFAELARENKVLVKETALMHYNLGVFYTQGKEYSRAIAEFEKAIELNPDDPYAYYNLGYIYAEYVVNRPAAIDNFRHFLTMAKAEDKDLDWVKKYILTWQTWEGKKPVE